MTLVEKNYNKFKKFVRSYVDKEGVEEFLAWLDTTDFATAPASSKYHLSCEGGLVKHSLNVFYRLFQMMKFEYPDEVMKDEEGNVLKDESGTIIVENTVPYSKSTIAFVALLHDISKTNYYKLSYRNVQNQENGQWEKKSFYSVREEDERMFYGSHEENSVRILSNFFNVEDEEAIAIRYHMGTMDGNETYPNRMYYAYKTSPLALLLHTADLWSMCIDEKENFENVELNQDVGNTSKTN